MFSKCHGKCQPSLNQGHADICPCLVSPPPVSPHLRRDAEGPPPPSPSPCHCCCISSRLQYKTLEIWRISYFFSSFPCQWCSRGWMQHWTQTICKLKTQVLFYLLRPRLLEQIGCQQRLDSCLAEWIHRESQWCSVVRHDVKKRCRKNQRDVMEAEWLVTADAHVCM